MGRITLFGGSGWLGRHLALRLAERGVDVRAASRHPATDLPAGVEPVVADIRDRKAVAAAVEGAELVVNFAGIVSDIGGQTFADVHVRGAGMIAEEARLAGSIRLVHLSALALSEDAPAASERSKAVGERAVRDAFPTATLVRPSMVYGPGDHVTTRFASMARKSPAVPVIGGGRTRFQPVHVEDMTAALLAILERREARGRIYEIGGPDILSFREILATVLAAADIRRPVLSIPFPVALMLATRVQRLPGWPLCADEVRLLETDKLVTGREPGLADLGIDARRMAQALSDYLGTR